MSLPPPSTFHVRMPKRLKDELQAAADRGDRSLNSEIVDRLEESFGPNEALLELAKALQPFLADLSDADRATLVAAARVIAKQRRKQQPPKQG